MKSSIPLLTRNLKLVIALVVFLGVLLLLFGHLSSPDVPDWLKTISNNLGYAFISSSVISLIIKLSFDNYLPQEIKNILIDSYDFFEVGSSIEKIHAKRPNAILESKVQSATESADFMMTNLKSIRELDNEFLDRLRVSTVFKIRILAICPNDNFLEKRILTDKIYNKEVDEFRKDFNNSLIHFKKIREDYLTKENSNRERFQIRVFTSTPGVAYYRIDKFALLGFYLIQGTSRNYTHFQINTENKFNKCFDEHFERSWLNAEDIEDYFKK